MKIFEVVIKPKHCPNFTTVVTVGTDNNTTPDDVVKYSAVVEYHKEIVLDQIEMYAESELFDELGDEIYDLDIEAVEITEKTE